MKQFEVPILLITFNRPDHTRQVWEAIKKQRPRYVYVFKDGVRTGNANDAEKGDAVKAIFEEPLDWECELKTYFADENLGCGPGPSTGISWFFSNVDEGIIIEDDAVPAQDFFGYAEELLERYREDKDVRAIGSMKIDPKRYGDSSYFYTMMNRNLCAWASWKRAWEDFDYTMSNVTAEQLDGALKKYKMNLRMREKWVERLEIIHRDRDNDSSWDMQFLMSIWLNNGVGVFPNETLSTNIGFDEEATHTFSADNPAANVALSSILPLKHPTSRKTMRRADINHDKLYTQPYNYGWKGFKRLPYRVNRRLKKRLNYSGAWSSFFKNR